jgi:hypothetical protein
MMAWCGIFSAWWLGVEWSRFSDIVIITMNGVVVEKTQTARKGFGWLLIKKIKKLRGISI